MLVASTNTQQKSEHAVGSTVGHHHTNPGLLWNFMSGNVDEVDVIKYYLIHGVVTLPSDPWSSGPLSDPWSASLKQSCAKINEVRK